MFKFLKHNWLPVVFFAAILVYFLCGLSPDMTWMSIGSDQGSYVVAALHNAPAGLSGNPLYILLGSLILKLPGNPFWLLGLLSAVPAAATCIVIFLIVKKFTTNSFAPYIGALAYASSFVIWSESVIAETYGLSLLVMSLVIYFCLSKKYLWMAIMMALTVGLHPLCIFVDIPCLVYVWWINGKNWKLAGQIVLVACLGLLFRLRDIFTVSPSTNTFYQQNPFQNLLFSAGGYFGLSFWPIGPTLQRIEEDFAALGSSLWCLIPIVCLFIVIKRRKEFILLGVIAVLGFFFGFSSIYPQWIKYMVLPSLPIAILAGIGVGYFPKNWAKLTPIFLIPCIVFMVLNIDTYSPGKTIDPQPTTARQFYDSLFTLPDNALIIDHTWGHPDLAIYYYVVNTHDRIDVIDYNTMTSGEFDMTAYKDAQRTKGINYPSILDTTLTPEQITTGIPVMTVSEFAKEMQRLNPDREVYITYVKSSAIPMEFGLVPANQYSSGINDIPTSKIQFSGG